MIIILGYFEWKSKISKFITEISKIEEIDSSTGIIIILEKEFLILSEQEREIICIGFYTEIEKLSIFPSTSMPPVLSNITISKIISSKGGLSK